MSRATVSRIWRRPTACSAALALASAILSRRSDVSSAPSNSSPVRGLRVTSMAGPFRRAERKSNTSTPLRRYVISAGPATDSTRPNWPLRAASAGGPNAYNAGMEATSLKELAGARGCAGSTTRTLLGLDAGAGRGLEAARPRRHRLGQRDRGGRDLRAQRKELLDLAPRTLSRTF